jgi:hypothetical protein
VSAPQTKKKTDAPLAVDPLLAVPVPHAYALIPDPAHRGRFFAVHLTNVVAGGIEHLEPSARSDVAPRGLMRMSVAMEKRHQRKTWGSEGEVA